MLENVKWKKKSKSQSFQAYVSVWTFKQMNFSESVSELKPKILSLTIWCLPVRLRWNDFYFIISLDVYTVC